MKNKELINKIQNKVKGDKIRLKKPLIIDYGDGPVEMTEIGSDNGEICVQSVSWVVPLTELTNKELVQLRKSI